MQFPNSRKYVCEMLGALFLALAVIGSGIMGSSVSPDDGTVLLSNAIVTGITLFLLITIFGPISGAHLNPIVTFCFWLRGDIKARVGLFYVTGQILGALLGCFLANYIFDLATISISTTSRTGPNILLSEAFASFGLILVILYGVTLTPNKVPSLVGIYITAAIIFCSSNSFANPAVTVARQFSDSFCGIAPPDVLGYIIMQVLGATTAYYFYQWFFASKFSIKND